MQGIKKIFILIIIFFPFLIEARNAQWVISGIVVDKFSKKPLADANIWLKRTKLGTTSDSSGYFKINLNQYLSDTLIIQFIGYQTLKVPVFSTGDKSFCTKYYLSKDVIPLPEVNISRYRYRDILWNIAIEPTPIRITAKDLNALPVFITQDVYRTLQTFPGINTASEISDQIYVRGGLPDQNLVLLDGATVYYPFHAFGLVTAFNQDIIGKISVSPGGFSARFGDKLSSVIDIKPSIPKKKIRILGNFNLINTGLTLSGKICPKFSWLISGRRSYYDFFVRKVPYSFYDLFAKLGYTVNKSNLFSFSAFLSNDLYDDKNIQTLHLVSKIDPSRTVEYKDITHNNYGWGNIFFNASWDFLWHHKFFSHFQTYYSTNVNHYFVNYSYEFPENLPEEFESTKKDIIKNSFRERNDIDNFFFDFTMKYNVSLLLHSKLHLDSGMEYSKYKTRYGWQNIIGNLIRKYYSNMALYFDYAPTGEFSYQKIFHKLSSFMELNWEISNHSHFRIGLRTCEWSYHKKINLEPRLNFSYGISKNLTTKLAYGRFTQGLATALEDGSIGFLELYFPVTNDKNIEVSNHYIFSIEYKSSNGLQFSVSPYLKNYSGLLRSIGPEPNFIPTPGKSRGVELSVLKKMGKWKFRLNTTISKTQRTVGNLTYDLQNDQRFRFQLAGKRYFSKHFQFNFLWLFHTGRPYTPYEYIAFERTTQWEKGIDHLDETRYRFVTIKTPRGRVRYPSYHRLDIAFYYSTKYKNLLIEPYFSIRNVYDRKNVLYYKPYFPEIFDNGELLLLKNKIDREYKFLPIIPSLGVKLKF